MTTVLDHLLDRLDDLAATGADQEAPSVILWPDKGRVWEQVIGIVGDKRTVLTLGSYAPEANRGPAYWIRYVLANRSTTDGELPVIYFPGFGREEFRATDDCPEELRPLVELQYRGAFWSQPNGRDWTPAAFLQNQERGLGITVAGDSSTIEALSLTLDRVLDQPVTWLERKQPVTATLLNQLIHVDLDQTLLSWIDDPEQTLQSLTPAEHRAFLSTSKSDLGFDPEVDGVIHAAGLLGKRDGRWRKVWSRFREAPERYPNLPTRLRAAAEALASATGQGSFAFDDRDAWPQANESEEADLEAQLRNLVDRASADEARERLRELETQHGARRVWVWAQLGQAPLAESLRYLSQLAALTTEVPVGDTGELAEWYADKGNLADDAALRAIAVVVNSPLAGLIRDVVRLIYADWLDEVSRRFQDAVGSDPSSYDAPFAPEWDEGTCVMFVDGLRYDIAQRVAQFLAGNGLEVDASWQLASLPTITATAKWALAPIADKFTGGPELGPVVSDTGSPVTSTNFKKALRDSGIEVLDDYEVGNPTKRGWVEAGNIDSIGHNQPERLPEAVEAEVSAIAGRISALLNEGWRRIEVVTDHGFLYLPRGLKKIELKAHLVAKRKGRCARLREAGQNGGQPTVPWMWDPSVYFAVARGAGCFEDGKEYEHGGVSPQECVVPRLVVRAPSTPTSVTVTDQKWVRLRFQLKIEGLADRVDLRTKPADPTSSLLEEPVPVEGGAATGVVPEFDAEGSSAMFVVLDTEGRLLAQSHTVVGDS